MEHLFQRVRWHSRRGMLELDLVFVAFTEQYFAALSATEQDDYVRLLACEDQDLLAWWLQHEQPQDAGLIAILNKIRTCHGSATTHPS